MANRELTEQSFLKDVATHEMKVRKDEGIYRHITFARPGSNVYRFDLVTWPGYLAYSGDMGCYVFSRIPDMFEFFRPDADKDALRINLGYWGEKVEARDRDGVREYSADRFIEHVQRHLDERAASDRDRLAAKYEVIDQAYDGQHAAYSAAMNFKGPDGTKFSDFWECNSDEYTHRFIWCCYALAWGIRQYDGKSIPEHISWLRLDRDGHKLIAERAMDRADRLEAALRKYGEHSTQCNRLGVINGDCYCGFAGVLDSLDERSQSDRGADHE